MVEAGRNLSSPRMSTWATVVADRGVVRGRSQWHHLCHPAILAEESLPRG
jgi:hypothetical protein